jgi:hypothetical protein
MTGIEYGRCRFCQADIQWALLKEKPHPFDVTPTSEGTHAIVVPDRLNMLSRPVARYLKPEERAEVTHRYTSHIGTCEKLPPKPEKKR